MAASGSRFGNRLPSPDPPQAAIATIIVRLGKGAPTAHPQFFDNSTFSLFVTVAGTCVASAILDFTRSVEAGTALRPG